MSENEKKSFDPFEQKMVEKPYAKDMIKASIGQYSEDEEDIPIPEATYIKPPPAETPPPNEVIDKIEDPPINPDFDSLPPHEQQSLAEKTADAYIDAYSKFIPIPFIRFSSFNMKKMSVLDKKGEISFKMVITDDGTNVETYMDQFNEKAEQIFIVQDDIKESIKEPLVEVIMEKGIVATPMQRLGIAVGSHILEMTKQTIELLMESRANIDVFKEFKAKEYAESNLPINNQQTQTPEKEQQTLDPKNDNVVFEEEETTYAKPPKSEELTVDDYLNDDISNKDVIIEEIEEETTD